jgi:hypothetical protein
MDYLTSKKGTYHGNSMEDCLSHLIQNLNFKKGKGLLLIGSWGIWLAQNAKLFEDKYSSFSM